MYKQEEHKNRLNEKASPKAKKNAESTSQFTDNKPEAIAEQKLQEISFNSKQSENIAQFQKMANQSQEVKQFKALAHSAPAQHVAINDDPSLEKEADIMGAKALNLKTQPNNQATASNGVVQNVEKSNNTGLPNQLKSGIEALSGESMDDVTVHYNSKQPAQLHAHAYAQGTEIHLASGQEQYLPHEAWHVVQQKQGRVQTTGGTPYQLGSITNIVNPIILNKLNYTIVIKTLEECKLAYKNDYKYDKESLLNNIITALKGKKFGDVLESIAIHKSNLNQNRSLSKLLTAVYEWTEIADLIKKSQSNKKGNLKMVPEDVEITPLIQVDPTKKASAFNVFRKGIRTTENIIRNWTIDESTMKKGIGDNLSKCYMEVKALKSKYDRDTLEGKLKVKWEGKETLYSLFEEHVLSKLPFYDQIKGAFSFLNDLKTLFKHESNAFTPNEAKLASKLLTDFILTIERKMAQIVELHHPIIQSMLEREVAMKEKLAALEKKFDLMEIRLGLKGHSSEVGKNINSSFENKNSNPFKPLGDVGLDKTDEGIIEGSKIISKLNTSLREKHNK